MGINLLGMDLSERRKQQWFTLLTRTDDAGWSRADVSALVNRLMTEAYEHPQNPRYLILFGQHDVTDVGDSIGAGRLRTASYPGIRQPHAPLGAANVLSHTAASYSVEADKEEVLDGG